MYVAPRHEHKLLRPSGLMPLDYPPTGSGGLGQLPVGFTT